MTSLLSIKLASKYAQLRDVESMRAIARAHQKRNLADFEKALKGYQQSLSAHLGSDSGILIYARPLSLQSSRPTPPSAHICPRCTTPCWSRICSEPYSVVKIEYIAQQVGQGRQAVELKCVSSVAQYLRCIC